MAAQSDAREETVSADWISSLIFFHTGKIKDWLVKVEPLKRDSHRFLLKNIIHWFFSLSGNVEDWLLEVERVMRDSLRKILGDSLEVYPTVSLYYHFIKWEFPTF